jgi:hypothetical protein
MVSGLGRAFALHSFRSSTNFFGAFRESASKSFWSFFAYTNNMYTSLSAVQW